jgi:MFS family permease
VLATIRHWFVDNFVELGREMRLSYLPPLMVYVAAGVSGLTGIVGTFFVKEYLGLSAAFLAALGFWAGIPWALKMPLGHLVDLIWRYKAGLVWLGAGLIAASLLIMLGLVAEPLRMRAVMSIEAWFVLSALLAPVGYVLQDVVADAMTVEAVPRVDEHGQPLAAATRRLMNTTLQTLGRVAIIGGGVLVSLVNVFMFAGVESLPPNAKAAIYSEVYALALLIPVISVAGVLLAALLQRRERQRLRARGFAEARLRELLEPPLEPLQPNWWILGGSLVFVVISLSVGLSQLPFGEEIVFLASFVVIVFLMGRLLRELDGDSRRTLLGTAIVIFVFRAVPGPGAGSTWWMIDALGFDQSFLAKLSLIASVLTLLGLFTFRRFMAERSIAYIAGFLTLAGTLLSLPTLGMYYGLHEWTAAHTGGIVDARFIALIDTALESPLGQIAMVPMLAWIANSAPANLKATYFAVMASFTNLALSASQLGTRYLNQIFEVNREVRDPVTNALTTPADYSQLGTLFMVSIVLGLVLPFAAIWLTRTLKLRSA